MKQGGYQVKKSNGYGRFLQYGSYLYSAKKITRAKENLISVRRGPVNFDEEGYIWSIWSNTKRFFQTLETTVFQWTMIEGKCSLCKKIDFDQYLFRLEFMGPPNFMIPT